MDFFRDGESRAIFSWPRSMSWMSWLYYQIPVLFSEVMPGNAGILLVLTTGALS